MFLDPKTFKQSAPGPTDDYWYNPAGQRSVSGFHVTEETALRLSTVYACVRVLAETVAQVPCPLYRRRDDGGKDKAVDHPLYGLINRRPNKNLTAFAWREMMQAHLGLRGNALNQKIYNGRGDVVELIPMHPDRVQYREAGGELRYHYTDKENKLHILLPEEVLHLKSMTRDGRVGMNPMEAARESVGLGLAAQEYGATFYRNGAQMPGWIEFEGKFKDREAREKFRESWQAAQTNRNRFKTPVLDAGFKYHEVGIKHSDAQFIETRKYQDNDIARIYRMQPHMVGILDRSTNNNIEKQSLEFVVYTMSPWFVRWEQSLSMALLDESEQEEYFFEFMFESLLRGDIKTRYEAYAAGIDHGFLTRNEVRKRENLDPIPGLDEPLEPLNMGRAGESRGSGKKDDANALAQAGAARVVNKELVVLRKVRERAGSDDEFRSEAVAFYAAHVDYVMQQMACDRGFAVDYCNESAEQIKTQDIEALFAAWEAGKAMYLANQRMSE